MPTKTKTETDSNATSPVIIHPLRLKVFPVTIQGITQLVVHRFDEKMQRQIGGLDPAGRGRKKQREPRNPEQEYKDSLYLMNDQIRYGFPTSKIKKAIVMAAHRDLGLPRTSVRSGLFILCEDGEWLSPINSPDGPKMRKDIVRLASGVPDMRFRGSFPTWEIDLRVEIDLDKLSLQDSLNLIERSGHGVGIGEARPEKSDIGWGRFRVKRG